MTSMNTIAIITPSYDNLAGLIRLVGSIEILSWPMGHITLYICNDGSTDKTVTYFENTKYKFEIKVLSKEEQAGPAAARNMGLEAAQAADLILFLDSDVEVAPDLIERHVDSYKTPEVIAVRGEYYTPVFTKKSKWLRYLDSTLRGPRLDYERNGKTVISYDKVNTNNLSVRASAVKELRFDEQIVHYGGEDMVFAYELSKLERGAILYLPEAMTYHQHNGFKLALAKLEEYGEQTMPYLLKAYPEMYSKLVISRFFKIDGKTEKVFWSRMIFNHLGYLGSRAIRLITPDFISFRAIQYIMAWHVLKGYRKSLKKIPAG